MYNLRLWQGRLHNETRLITGHEPMNALHACIIFTIIALGFFCGKKHVFKEIHVEGFELFLFKVVIPCYLFSAIMNNTFSNLVNINYVYSYLITFVILATITTTYLWRTHTISSLCIRLLASGYVNTAIYTLPVVTFLLGDPKAAILGNLLQVIIIQSAFLVLFNCIQHREGTVFQKILTSFKSPMITLPVTAMILNYYEINMDFLSIVAKDLGGGASGMALFTFGLTLSHVPIKKEHWNKDLLSMLLAKNILHPLIAFLVGHYIFCLEKYWLNALVIAASAPTAFVVTLIARQFAIDTYFVRIMVALSSMISLVFLVFIMFFLKT